MLTLYELEVEVRARAAKPSTSGLGHRSSLDGMPVPALRRTPSLWLAGTLRAMADRLEARAVRAA